MKALVIMLLWTWGITPLWVNIVGTILMGAGMLMDLYDAYAEGK